MSSVQVVLNLSSNTKGNFDVEELCLADLNLIAGGIANAEDCAATGDQGTNHCPKPK